MIPIHHLEGRIDMDTGKIEHLKMIQDVIKRMANNSLQIKCWCLAIVSASIVLSRSSLIVACILPVVLFCYLDVNYLSLERSYRDLYDEVRAKDETDIDFSMRFTPSSKWKSFKSWSIWPFYGLMVALLSIVSAINHIW